MPVEDGGRVDARATPVVVAGGIQCSESAAVGVGAEEAFRAAPRRIGPQLEDLERVDVEVDEKGAA